MFDKKTVLTVFRGTREALFKEKHHVLALFLIALWCLPYFTSGEKIEWGDYGYYAQMYQAMRINILDYHQFPWWNPWLAGGAPLYANPQLGVFSIQSLLVLCFGGSLGLKFALVIYTLAGYIAMYWLMNRFFKVGQFVSSALGLVWIFSSFFVSHLPSHFTFAWFMLVPAFIYLALILRTKKQGLVLGVGLALSALSAVHYAFFHAVTLVAIILAVRFIWQRRERMAIVKAGGIALGTLVVLAGHRIILTLENVSDFPRLLSDPAATVMQSFMSLVLPYSTAHPFSFIAYPSVPFGWGEQTATVGIFVLIAALLSVFFYVYDWRSAKRFKTSYLRWGAITIVWATAFLLIGLGSFAEWAPWNILRNIPPFSYTRVSPRWFLWVVLAILVFVGLTIKRQPRNSAYRFTLIGLLGLGVIELFVMNFGYQHKLFKHDLIKPQQSTNSFVFEQQSEFGESLQLPGNKGTLEDDGSMPVFYRELEATMFNIGTLQANDSLIDLNTKPTPRCSWARGCGLVLSGNARVVSWSPAKVVLSRTGPGDIKLNMNNSNYFVINGVRDNSVNVAEPYKDFVIKNNDKTITIQVDPALDFKRMQRVVQGAMERRTKVHN